MSLADNIGNIGRAIQTRIYREGVYGRKPRVPVDPRRLSLAARSAISRRAWNYLRGSAGAESTAAANRAAFERHRIVPSMLRDVSSRNLGIELFGRAVPAPLFLSPIGVLELVHRHGDLAVARAAAATGVPVTLSTQASYSMERVAEVAPDAVRWFQLYWSSDDDLVTSMLRRAEESGCEAIVITLDTHVLGWRPRDLDAGFLPFAHGQGIAQYTADPVFASLVRRRAERPASSPAPTPTPQALRALWSMSRNHPGSLLANLRSPYPRAAVETFLDVFSRSSLTWDELDFVRQRTNLPIVLKGLQHVEDARRALDAGVDGILVSNHGGRQIDGALGALDALPGIVAEVDDRIPVLFDSGIRTGADACKALALGATAAGIGRPYAYGLAAGGAEGVRTVLEHLVAELDITMALAGIAAPSELEPGLLRPVHS
ncbi:lactate 2-monooxygenase [Actinopolyspora alba]|uniref:Lactate 2-monooxygenase n=1 Tax=Actinopolyspora alba TaxID=673379 RepID=A0A1I1WSF8_9ACTN|nr:alpha-hydroxy-acid oxidizing protein [Actinopolyspora alba]SFD97982.1 lactate 2-monooxygenase [Actinopolyspora alba]